MAVGAPARRMIGAVLFLLVVGVAFSIWRGDSPGTTVGQAVAVLVGGGLVIGCYLWVRRKN